MNGELVLTEVQLQAIDAPRGRLIFLGPCGSGKSTVIIERAIRLVKSGAAKSETVLLLAPSRRAAVAIGRSVHGRLGASQGMTAVSFHGLALAILRRHYRDMGYSRPPRLLSTARQFHLLRTILAQENPALWPHHPGQLGNSVLCSLTYRLVMGMAENVLDAAELQSRARVWGRLDLEELAAFAVRYGKRLREAGFIDFGLLLTSVIELLATNQGAASVCRRTYRHILVDEFEQANSAQVAILSHLLDGETDLLVAGDAAQAINSYRSGTPAHLITYPERIGAQVVVSNENHRCRRRIASLSTALRPTEPGMPRFEMTRAEGLVSGQAVVDERDNDAGFVVLRQFTYQSQEARWIGAEVDSLLRAGIPPTRIAILFRSLATPVADLVAGELDRRRIPYEIRSRRTATSDPLVRGAIAVLRYISISAKAAQPRVEPAPFDGRPPGQEASSGGTGSEKGEENLLLRILESPIGGLPPFGLQELRRAAALAGRGLADLERDGLEGLALREELRAALGLLLDRLNALRQKVDSSASDLLWEVWRLFPAFRDDALSGKGSSVVYASLLDEVASIEDERGFLGLEDFISLANDGFFEHLGSFLQRARGLIIGTVHLSKGQEWDIVFLPALVEGFFPSQRSPLDIGPLLASDYAPSSEQDQAEAAAEMVALCHAAHVAEEQRVFYVAVSRARHGLYLSHSQRTADGRTIQLPSRFLHGLAERPEVEVVPGYGEERLPEDVEGAVIHYRRLLRSTEPLMQAKALYGLVEIRERWPETVQPEEWWSNVHESAGAAPPFPDRRLYLSASRLGTYRDCPLAYQFGYHWGLSQVEGPGLTIGSILHAVLEDYHREGSPLPRTREALEERLDYHFDGAAFRYRPIARQARKVLGEMLDKYFARYGESNSVIVVEKHFAFDFGPHRITGVIDRIDRLPNGRLEIVDYKTGQAMTKAEAESDLQLALYDLAFFHDDNLQALGQPGLASYLYLKCIGPRADGKRSYSPSDESRERLKARVTYYSDAILAERFPPHRSLAEIIPAFDPAELDRALRKDPCRFCAFGWLCPEMEREASDE